MNASRINLGLKMTTALLGAAACAVVGVGLFLPLDGAGESVQISAPLKLHPVGQRLPAIDSFAPIFSRTVQPAPTNVAAAPAQTETATTGAASAAAVIAQISLVGTIGDSIALLRGPGWHGAAGRSGRRRDGRADPGDPPV